MSYKIILDRIEEAARSDATELDLSGFSLPSLPLDIVQLVKLTSLDLSNNQITYLPEGIGNLVNLTSLNLSKNELESLPTKIGRLVNLSLLDLSSNKLTTLPKEISRLVKLISLDFSSNKLTTLPVEVGKLVNLVSLNLCYNKLTTLPFEIRQLVSLTSLGISPTHLNMLPVEIGQLVNLKTLRLSGGLFENQLTSLSEEIGQLVNLISLDLSGNHLVSLPVEIKQLTNLALLDLSNNHLASLPEEIGQLTNLTSLNLSDNKLASLVDIRQFVNLTSFNLSKNNFASIPVEIGQLKNLASLNLANNQLTTLPVEIGQLVNLISLDLSDNQLISLPADIENLKKLKELYLDRNSMPIAPEILKRAKEPQAIFSYFFSSLKKALNECKVLVVGQGSVGKTSLIHRLLENKFDPKENKTEGIDIRHFNFRVKDAAYNINVWDFGGQEIMHATHQFFLTKRSLYLLVLDSRLTQEENRVEYWLKMIDSFGGDSPVLVVGNKTDQHPLDIDRSGLQKKYPKIVDILETSAATGNGMHPLRIAIAEQIHSLPHVRDLLPESWFMVKKQLEELGHIKNFIRYDEFQSLCNNNEVSDEGSQRILIGFMHDLGVVLHFQDDPRLEALGILNPQWVTNGVYRIINSHTMFQSKGALSIGMLNEILNLPEYPRDKRLFIVDMMKKFELCYEIHSDKTFLVPDLLPKDEPAELKFNGVPAFEYAYPVLPSSVITRFIVRMNQKIDDGFVWRTGVVLKIGENKALVKADIEDRKITIAIEGLEHTRRETLTAIFYHLNDIHDSIKGLNPEKLVPVPGAENAKPIPYNYLLMLEAKDIEILPVQDGNRLIDVNIRKILSGVPNEIRPKESAASVTNYYIAGDGGIVVGGNATGNNLVTGNYNKINSAEIDPELKDILLQLGKAVDAMIQKLPAEQAAEVAEDYGKLADEAVKPKPNKKWYSVSIEGLIKAAENLDKLGEPVISLSQKVLSLLTGGVVE